MANNYRGRRDVASHLGLMESPVEGDPTVVVNRGGRRAAAAKTSVRSKSRARSKPRGRSKLPSDKTIVGFILRRVLRWGYRLLAGFFITSVAMVIVYRFVDPPFTPLMLIRPLEGLGEGRFVWVSKQWIDLRTIDPDMVRSVVAAEDARFFQHTGIDWKAIDDAQRRNERNDGRKIYGGSTISMQCAKNVFLWQGRNYLRKGLEAYFTYLIELVWGKERILEVYLNVIEWGDGVYGVEAAARENFGRSASDLSPRQAALLAAVLPNPRRYSAKEPGVYVTRRAASIQSGARIVRLPYTAVAPEPPAAQRKRPKRR